MYSVPLLHEIRDEEENQPIHWLHWTSVFVGKRHKSKTRLVSRGGSGGLCLLSAFDSLNEKAILLSRLRDCKLQFDGLTPFVLEIRGTWKCDLLLTGDEIQYFWIGSRKP